MEDKDKKFGIISYPESPQHCSVVWYNSAEEAISELETYADSKNHILVMKVELTKKYYINDNLIGEDNEDNG